MLSSAHLLYTIRKGVAIYIESIVLYPDLPLRGKSNPANGRRTERPRSAVNERREKYAKTAKNKQNAGSQ